MGRRRWRQQRGDCRVGVRAEALPEAIAALSRTLPTGPSPEIFRRAKFDLPEAVPALWQLLFHVLSQVPEDCATTSLTPEAQVRWVKSTLRSQGYPRPALALLPEDGTQGSRELLLALSWLLARGPLLERVLTCTRVRLGDEMSVCECVDLARGRASLDQPTACKDSNSCLDVRHVQWLMGKLRFQWRNLISSHQEHCALLSKIHQYTRGCHSDRNLCHLSVAEVELLSDPEVGKQLLQRLECENARLEAALDWCRLEPVFWKWTDTVLDASPPGPPDTGSQPTFLPRISDQGTRGLELLAWELQALQEQLGAAVEARRTAWAVQVLAREPEWRAAMQTTEEAVERELEVLRQTWEQGADLTQLHGLHRLVRSETGALPGWGLHVTEAVGALRSKEACLEAALGWLQEQCRQELTRLVGALPELLWIPPHGHWEP
ncbi:PREDICTED: uncharacterized protein C14orf80 homolog [Chrysochloris asiatica]|uniref:Uncharacterized protein C14orf80 homolog n=1 Tax=Chrysochloris asiatica TaxID=185453 RepID=A0A9B0WKW0_CHRAS|nr:PREDICTED: uncharacterized protein C14orf80 homolog [Chrysochloris asiatica]